MTVQMTPLVYSWVCDLQIDEKYEYVLRDYTWHLNNYGRPVTNNPKRKDGSRKFEGLSKTVRIHQLIMFLEYGKKSDIKRQVRHANHDRLDNRLVNLSFGSARDNALDHNENTGVNPTYTGKWLARAYLGSKHYFGRSRENREDAQFDYDMMTAMYDYHGILPKTLQDRRDLPEYISQKRNRKTNPYFVQKWHGSRMVNFGSYPSVKEAVDARDKLIANGWVR